MISKEIARILLDKKAVTLNAKEPYTYASGIRSPIYCDNRALTFFPAERNVLINSFVEKVKEFGPEVIAGTESSAISWAAWISDRLDKPMVYIRKKTKGHGTGKLIEGGDISGKKVVVVEDLISTGESSMNAVEACREAGAKVLGIVAIFTYGFEKAKKRFEEGNCRVKTLSDFSALVEVAKETGALDNIKVVLEWNKNPSDWGPKHGFPNKNERTD